MNEDEYSFEKIKTCEEAKTQITDILKDKNPSFKYPELLLADFNDNYEIKVDNNGNFKKIVFDESTEDLIIDNENEESDTSEIMDITISQKTQSTLITLSKYYEIINPTFVPDLIDPEPIFPFKPDNFQNQAFFCLSRNRSILVSAHTSSGKTAIFEYTAQLARYRNVKLIYTSPIKALSNQKFFEMRNINPGIITGDTKINPESDILIMTTEILRNLLHLRSPLLHNLEYVVFDEVHYLSDEQRGVVWEECLIMLPVHIKVILLSASIPNEIEFSNWVGRIRNTKMCIIKTLKRIVPLEFYLIQNEDINLIYKEGNVKPTFSLQKEKKIFKKSNLVFITNFITEKRLFPCIYFCFSKKLCYSTGIQFLKSYTTNDEKAEIRHLIKTMLDPYLPFAERNLSQIIDIKKMCVNGIAIHHSGLLPILKEFVEILFSRSLIKILIATETFSMGVNYPAKCVVFMQLKKRDNHKFRMLEPGEFLQMSGRAGRRGIDKKGFVFILDNSKPNECYSKILINLIKSNTPIQSKFRMTFNSIMRLLRSNCQIEDIIKQSFEEEAKQKHFDLDEIKIVELRNKLVHWKPFEDICRVNDCRYCLDIDDSISNISASYFCIQKIIQMDSSVLEKDSIILLNNGQAAKIIDLNSDNTVSVLFDNVHKNKFDTDFAVNDVILWYPLNFVREYNENNFKIEKIIKTNKIVCVLKQNKIFTDFKSKYIHAAVKIQEYFDIINNLNDYRCFNCPFIEEHFNEKVYFKEVNKKTENLKSKYDSQMLKLYDDYVGKIEFLTFFDYIDENRGIKLKGRIACEIKTVNEIFFTEMLINNLFSNMKISQINAFVSGFLTKESNEEKSSLYTLIEEKVNYVFNCLKITDYQFKTNTTFYSGHFEFLYNDSYVDAVENWCNGMLLMEIVLKNNISEGVLVRIILRLIEFCKEMKACCLLIDDNTNFMKFEQCIEIMDRDIIRANSLYLQNK